MPPTHAHTHTHTHARTHTTTNVHALVENRKTRTKQEKRLEKTPGAAEQPQMRFGREKKNRHSETHTMCVCTLTPTQTTMHRVIGKSAHTTKWHTNKTEHSGQTPAHRNMSTNKRKDVQNNTEARRTATSHLTQKEQSTQPSRVAKHNRQTPPKGDVPTHYRVHQSTNALHNSPLPQGCIGRARAPGGGSGHG